MFVRLVKKEEQRGKKGRGNDLRAERNTKRGVREREKGWRKERKEGNWPMNMHKPKGEDTFNDRGKLESRAL